MKILLLDNYDSFTYNLVHILRELGQGPGLSVVRNDAIALEEINRFDKIMLSPGPGLPHEAGIMLDLLQEYQSTKSILGVCLGHQGIGQTYGAKLLNLEEVLHGVTTPIHITGEDPLFNEIPARFNACHYHSWIIGSEGLPSELEVLAVDDQNQIMAIRHLNFDVRGVQFHPESILTEHGVTLIDNWLKI